MVLCKEMAVRLVFAGDDEEMVGIKRGAVQEIADEIDLLEGLFFAGVLINAQDPGGAAAVFHDDEQLVWKREVMTAVLCTQYVIGNDALLPVVVVVLQQKQRIVAFFYLFFGVPYGLVVDLDECNIADTQCVAHINDRHLKPSLNRFLF